MRIVACRFEDIDGTGGECDDGPISTLVFVYDGQEHAVLVCDAHRAEYHRRLRPFKFHAWPVNEIPGRSVGARYDGWGQIWEPQEIRFWLRHFAGIEVSDRARLHPSNHYRPWEEASGRDRDLRDRVQAAMAAEKEAKKARARQQFKDGDPRVTAMVQARVARKRAEKAGQ